MSKIENVVIKSKKSKTGIDCVVGKKRVIMKACIKTRTHCNGSNAQSLQHSKKGHSTSKSNEEASSRTVNRGSRSSKSRLTANIQYTSHPLESTGLTATRNSTVFHSSSLGCFFRLGRFTSLVCGVRSLDSVSQKVQTDFSKRILRYGNNNENVAKKVFLHYHGQYSMRCEVYFVARTSLYTMSISPDGTLYGPDGRIRATYESKCPIYDLPSSPHMEHLLQVQAQIQATGVSYGYLHYWTPSESRMWTVRRNDTLWRFVIQYLSVLYEIREDSHQVQMLASRKRLMSMNNVLNGTFGKEEHWTSLPFRQLVVPF